MVFPLDAAQSRESSRLLQAARRLEDSEGLDALANALGRVAAPLRDGVSRKVLGGAWLGHAVHPLLTDFPLGSWIGGGLLDLFGGVRSRAAAQRLTGLGVAFVVPTALAGLSDWAASRDRRVGRVGAAHAGLNGVVATSYLMSWLQRRRGNHAAGVGLAMIGGTTAWVSGYLGGHLSLRLFAGTGDPDQRQA